MKSWEIVKLSIVWKTIFDDCDRDSLWRDYKRYCVEWTNESMDLIVREWSKLWNIIVTVVSAIYGHWDVRMDEEWIEQGVE
jgi:hypothetical protein